MSKSKTITLCWYAKTDKKPKKGKLADSGKPMTIWQYFPALLKVQHGVTETRHGWVKDKVKDGVKEVEYPTGRYVLRSYVGGRKVYTPLDTLNPRDAVLALVRARKEAIKDGPARNPKAVIKTAVPAYIRDCERQGHMDAAEHARLVLDEFTPLCNVTYVRGITREMLLAFHKKLRDRGLAARTIANKDARVRSWLKFCDVEIKSLPPKPKFEETLPEIYTPGEVKAILEAADPYMSIAIRMALMLGLREQEVMYSEWADIDWHHAVYRVQGKKRKDWKFEVKDKAQRDVPIPKELLASLKQWQKERKGTSLIVGNDDDKPEGHFLRKVKNLAKNAGLNCNQCETCLKNKECERWFLHKFRATFCTRMLRQADDLALRMRIP
jgi:integrase